ncbi:hypothetical protein G3I19_01175 [Streptomyces sp. SID10853]|uniref:hypothetical protein n=1 Tax=Streptomyces sp. SID10853 TaxID=2706028 RepID=UPI0013C14FA0|nr:hypothetical protein [Streptomyces sp. SID10853]NDZ77156.1 hypothetical protein [Streptomyces sp. SID10853]
MAELVEFDDLQQVEVLLRAGIELKFELSEDSEILNGSPVFAGALNSLRDGLIAAVRSGPSSGNAQSYVDWYQISAHPHRWVIITRRAVLHPHVRDLTTVEMRQWVETLAAPLAVDGESMEAIKAEVEKILDRG